MRSRDARKYDTNSTSADRRLTMSGERSRGAEDSCVEFRLSTTIDIYFSRPFLYACIVIDACTTNNHDPCRKYLYVSIASISPINLLRPALNGGLCLFMNRSNYITYSSIIFFSVNIE